MEALGTRTTDDDKETRLKTHTEPREAGLNKLFEEFSALAVAESDALTQFKAQTGLADPKARSENS